MKVKQLKLEGLCKENIEDDEGDKVVVIVMKWKGPKAMLVPIPFFGTSTCQRDYTSQSCLRKGEPTEWEDEFESVCNFTIFKDGSFAPWDVTFNVLYGERTESKSKLAILGKVSLNLAELASNLETQMERKLPITLRDGGLTREATLLVSMSFVEVIDSHESPRVVPSSVESDKEHVLLTKEKSLVSFENEKNQNNEGGSNISDKSAVFDSKGSSQSITMSDKSNVDLTSMVELDSFQSLETQSDSERKRVFSIFSWKRRRLSFRPTKTKAKSFTSGPLRKADATGSSSELDFQDDNCITSNWEAQELVSRDGHAKLKTNVFLASMDQRSEKASGESACTALVTVIAHWLHSNQDMPTRPEFDSLIIEGSSEWQKLCNNNTYIQFFPDKHFDLDTVIDANLRPLSVLHEKSFIGFFCPEKFECLKEAMSFDEIWNKISGNTEVYEPSIYIVSWNDHFFVLKVEANAYYIIDSLGERLFEGCNQAYILKFDDSSLMHEKVKKENEGSQEKDAVDEEVICSGKECCKEFIKRFLAAIPLRELEEEQEKGTISNYSIHQRLQIEFHLCSSPSTSTSPSSCSSSSSTFTSSLFSGEELM